MKLSFTEDEMLALWRLHCILEPLAGEDAVERTDGVALDDLFRHRMRGWYLNLLDTAPERYLSPENIALTAKLTVHDGVVWVKLPASTRRVLSVRLDCWERPASIVTPESPLYPLQASRYARGGTEAPVACLDGDILRLYSLPEGEEAVVTELMVVTVPADGRYEFDEAALELLPSPSDF